jgi:hypothetical protein
MKKIEIIITNYSLILAPAVEKKRGVHEKLKKVEVKTRSDSTEL